MAFKAKQQIIIQIFAKLYLEITTSSRQWETALGMSTVRPNSPRRASLTGGCRSRQQPGGFFWNLESAALYVWLYWPGGDESEDNPW